MESQPQNPEFRINPENFHPCIYFFVFQFLKCNALYGMFNRSLNMSVRFQ